MTVPQRDGKSSLRQALNLRARERQVMDCAAISRETGDSIGH